MAAARIRTFPPLCPLPLAKGGAYAVSAFTCFILHLGSQPTGIPTLSYSLKVPYPCFPFYLIRAVLLPHCAWPLRGYGHSLPSVPSLWQREGLTPYRPSPVSSCTSAVSRQGSRRSPNSLKVPYPCFPFYLIRAVVLSSCAWPLRPFPEFAPFILLNYPPLLSTVRYPLRYSTSRGGQSAFADLQFSGADCPYVVPVL